MTFFRCKTKTNVTAAGGVSLHCQKLQTRTSGKLIFSFLIGEEMRRLRRIASALKICNLAKL
jgi:hypothetical protein